MTFRCRVIFKQAGVVLSSAAAFTDTQRRTGFKAECREAEELNEY